MKHVPGKVLVKLAMARGWRLDRIKGSHHILEKDGRDEILVIPVHGNQALKTGTQRAIMKVADIKEDEL